MTVVLVAILTYVCSETTESKHPYILPLDQTPAFRPPRIPNRIRPKPSTPLYVLAWELTEKNLFNILRDGGGVDEPVDILDVVANHYRYILSKWCRSKQYEKFGLVS